MRTLYIECKMGVAGDMLMAALYELLTTEQQTEFLSKMNQLLHGEIHVSPEVSFKCGIKGTHMHVDIHGTEEHPHEVPHEHLHAHSHTASCGHTHEHHSYASILEHLAHMDLPSEVSEHAANIYRLLGEAESYVHGTTLEQIHFHEVGSLDALADIVGCCLLFSMLKPDCILASPIHVGNGTVHCAHGTLPVPAPATAKLLENIPYYMGDINSELCTPTGAALLRHFCTDFKAMPVMKTEQIGIGLGTKDFATANCVRVFLGEVSLSDQDTFVDLSCNLYDMTGEELGFCMEILLESGALDVFYQPIQMKKNRPGILLHCFCNPCDKERFLHLILKYTTTRGVRYQEVSRTKLSADFEEIHTAHGTIRNKINSGYGITKSKPEYEDLRRIALEQDLPLSAIRQLLLH